VCHLVGHLARSFQADLLIKWNDQASAPKASRTSESLLFGRLLFPCFICELVLKGQYLLGGFIISRWMHTHPSLGLMDILETSVHHFLEGQVSQVQQTGGSEPSFTDNVLSKRHANSYLQSRLVSLLQAALAAIPN
jgi:neuroblastoma-amplified sequence